MSETTEVTPGEAVRAHNAALKVSPSKRVEIAVIIMIPGYKVSEYLAVNEHQIYSCWCVTHLPTGVNLTDASGRGEATRLAKVLAEKYGQKLASPDSGEIARIPGLRDDVLGFSRDGVMPTIKRSPGRHCQG